MRVSLTLRMCMCVAQKFNVVAGAREWASVPREQQQLLASALVLRGSYSKLTLLVYGHIESQGADPLPALPAYTPASLPMALRVRVARLINKESPTVESKPSNDDSETDDDMIVDMMKAAVLIRESDDNRRRQR